jgi:PEGA domain
MKRTLVLGGAALALAACATVTRGTTNQVQFRTEPPGALAVISMSQTCTTPCTITVNRKDEFAVRFSLAGYKDATVEVRTQVAGTGVLGVAGNAVIGGVIGVGVDVVTGSALDHVPNPVVVTLERVGTPNTRPVPPRSPGRIAAPVPVPSHPGIAPPVQQPADAAPPPPPSSRQPEPSVPLSPGVVPPST